MTQDILNSSWFDSLNEEDRAALKKIKSEELICDWCGIPLEARLIPDSSNPEKYSVEIFCKTCTRIYSLSSKNHSS